MSKRIRWENRTLLLSYFMQLTKHRTSQNMPVTIQSMCGVKMEEKTSTETQIPYILYVPTNRHTKSFFLFPSTLVFKKKASKLPHKYILICLYLSLPPNDLLQENLRLYGQGPWAIKLYSINYRPVELHNKNSINLKRHLWQHMAYSTHVTFERAVTFFSLTFFYKDVTKKDRKMG